MPNTVISVENLTKRYDLGVIGTGTLSRDLNRWWAHLRHQPDLYTHIGQENHIKRCGELILALDDVSFTVQQGEALGIIGKNGAGISTYGQFCSDLYPFNPFTYPETAHFAAHNTLLSVAVDLGLPALVLYTAALSTLGAMLSRPIKTGRSIIPVLLI